MPRLLVEIEFRHPSRARAQMSDVLAGLPESIATRVQVLVASVPDPDQAVHYLDRLRTENPGWFGRISNSPATLGYLIAVFSYSNFLSDELLRHPAWLVELTTSGDLHRALAADEYKTRLSAMIAPEGV